MESSGSDEVEAESVASDGDEVGQEFQDVREDPKVVSSSEATESEQEVESEEVNDSGERITDGSLDTRAGTQTEEGMEEAAEEETTVAGEDYHGTDLEAVEASQTGMVASDGDEVEAESVASDGDEVGQESQDVREDPKVVSSSEATESEQEVESEEVNDSGERITDGSLGTRAGTQTEEGMDGAWRKELDRYQHKIAVQQAKEKELVAQGVSPAAAHARALTADDCPHPATAAPGATTKPRMGTPRATASKTNELGR